MLIRSSIAIHAAAFCLSVAALLLAWFDTLSHMSNILWTVDSYSHGLLVPAISLGLIYSRRDEFRTTEMSFWIKGIPVLLGAAGVWYFGTIVEVRLLEHFALVLAIQGLALSCFGWTLYQRFIFPFLFLFLAIPIGDSLIPILQTFTAESVIFLLGFTGIDFEAEGVLLTLPSGMYEVARACAGIKFFFTSVVTGVLLTHLIFNGWRKRLAVLLLAAVLPVAANALRVLGILLIAEATDQSFAKGVDHIVYGWGFLSFILLLLIAIAYKFADPPIENPEPDYETQSVEKRVLTTNAIAIFGLALLVPSFSALAAPSFQQVIVSPKSIVPPDCENCSYRLLKSVAGSDQAFWLGADSEFHFRYRTGGDVFSVSGALFCPQRPGNRLIQYGHAPAGQGWEYLPSNEDPLVTEGNWRLVQRTYWKGKQRKTVFLGYFVNGKSVASEYQVKLETAFERFYKGASAGAVIAVSVPASKGVSLDREKIQKFLSTFQQEAFLWKEISSGEEGQTMCAA